MYSFQKIIAKLKSYWFNQGCLILEPMDIEMGAATFHQETFFRSIKNEPWQCAYLQACRRPSDGRYGDSPNRLQRYYQFQVILKPVPDDFQHLYMLSLKKLGIDLIKNELSFIEDDWESPTLAAWGLGWEVLLNGMEVSQITYFQQVGGITCNPIVGEITYGLERIALYVQNKKNVFDILWGEQRSKKIYYSDLFAEYEKEMCQLNFTQIDIKQLIAHFNKYEKQALFWLEKSMPLIAYEIIIKATHTFNMIDAKKAISVTERQNYILRIRTLAVQVAKIYLYQHNNQHKAATSEKLVRSSF